MELRRLRQHPGRRQDLGKDLRWFELGGQLLAQAQAGAAGNGGVPESEAAAIAGRAGRRREDLVHLGSRTGFAVALLAVEEAVLAFLALHDRGDPRRLAGAADQLCAEGADRVALALALGADELRLLLPVAVGAAQFSRAGADVADRRRLDRPGERREVVLDAGRRELDGLQRGDRTLE